MGYRYQEYGRTLPFFLPGLLLLLLLSLSDNTADIKRYSRVELRRDLCTATYVRLHRMVIR